MDNRQNLPPLREVISQYGLSANKALGQHFLLDSNLTDRIARSVDDLSSGTTIEIGPGPGGLTRSLLAGGASIIAVEKDSRFAKALEPLQDAYPGRLEILTDDALNLDISSLGEAQRRVVSNLPYNVGTELLLLWLRDTSALTSLTLMFQREVAARITAPANTKAYGRLSVICQWLCDAEILFHVNPQAFTPPPAVDSTVVRLTPLPTPRFPADRTTLERVTAAGFGQRRKMLRQSLMPLLQGSPWNLTETLCRHCDIDPTARAETLSLEQFCRLAVALKAGP